MSDSRSPFAYVGMGLEIAAPVALLLLGGSWLDSRLGTRPWLMLVGAFVGMAVGFYTLVRRVSASRPDEDDQGD